MIRETRAAVRHGTPSLTQGTVLNFADGAITLVSASVVSVVLARILGPDRFGLYSLVMSIVTFTYLFARLGINETVRRYVAELDGRGERALAAIVAGRGLRIGLVTGGTAAIVLAGGALPLAAFFHNVELHAYLLLGAATVVPMMTAGLMRSVLRGIQQYHYFLRMNVITSPLWVAASTVVVWRGGGIAALLGVGLGIQLVNLAVLGWWTRREVGIRWHGQLPPALHGRLLRYNLALAVLLVLNAIVWQRSELLFLGWLQGPDQVAYYVLPFALTERLTALLPGALLGVLLPGLTYAHAAMDPARFAALLSQAVRYLAMLTLPICLFGIPLAPVVIRLLYGPRYSPAVAVLQILFIAMIFGVLGQAATSALLGIEAHGWLLKTGAVAALVSLALDLVLIPRWGAVGAALANTVGQAGWALASSLPLRRRVAASTWTVVLRAAAVAAVVAMMLAFAVRLSVTAPALVLAGLGAFGLYFLALERLHLVSPRSIRPACFLSQSKRPRVPDRHSFESRLNSAVPTMAGRGVHTTGNSPSGGEVEDPNRRIEASYHPVHDFAGLSEAMVGELAAAAEGFAGKKNGQYRALLDAFLMAAGLNQIVEDYLHRDLLGLKKAAKHLAEMAYPLGSLAGDSSRCGSAMLHHLRWRTWERSVVQWQMELADFVQRLADEVVQELDCRSVGGQLAAHRRSESERAVRVLLQVGHYLLTAARDFPTGLRRSVVRLPACFFTFDQEPVDCRQIVEAFAEKWPERNRPLAIVGMRTSGSYLAPLIAGFLKARGFQDLHMVTWRSRQQWLGSEHRRLAAVKQGGGLALLTDDPPTSGVTLASAAEELLRMGFPRESIILLLALFDSPTWWPWRRRLETYETIALPWHLWTIHERLKPRAVQEALTDLLVGRRIGPSLTRGPNPPVVIEAVKQVERIPLPSVVDLKARRALRDQFRARALYRVQLVDKGTGRQVEHQVYAKGIGLGYLGDYSSAIARRLPGFFPEVYGSCEGVLYRAWVPEEQRLNGLQPTNLGTMAARIASYVAARSRTLAVAEDVSQRLVGREALWEHCGHLLSQAFGRGAPLIRLLLRERFKRLLRASRPSVIDASMARSQWFRPAEVSGQATEAALLKVGFDEGAFPGGAVYCYDAAFDLASAALDDDEDASHEGPGQFSHLLRQIYASLGAGSVSDERWLLYQLLQVRRRRGYYFLDHRLHRDSQELVAIQPRRPTEALEDHQDSADGPGPSRFALVQALGPMGREMSRLHERYFGRLFFGDATPAISGPLCAVDVDGVLETPWLGFAAITPAGAVALRALACHGYRAVLTTGRCLQEVRERCSSYRLAGGVAEYGAVIYNHLSGMARAVLSVTDETDLNTLRGVLLDMDDVHLDPTHQHAVRAFRIKEERQCALDPETIERALAKACRPRLQAIVGRAQTDFITAGFNKGTGLRALAEDLAVTGARSDGSIVALAVGDTSSDLPIFELAHRSFAPANADRAVRSLEATGTTRLKVLRRPYQAGLLLAVASILGHRPGRCVTCRAPCLSGDARLLTRILGAQDVGSWGKIKLALLLAAGTVSLGRQVDASAPSTTAG